MAYTGIYERTIFYNPVNKYSVISVKTSDRSIPEKARSAYRHRDNMIHFAAVGYELPRTDQVSMILDGEWKEGKNGFQLHVTKCEEVVPQTREGIKGYLSSRLIAAPFLKKIWRSYASAAGYAVPKIRRPAALLENFARNTASIGTPGTTPFLHSLPTP